MKKKPSKRKQSIKAPKLSDHNVSKASQPAEPDSSSETVLLAVIGKSPAVLTETVWALAHESNPTIPARIIAITTTEGRDEISRRLFQSLPQFGEQTPWEALRAALELEGHDLTGRLRFGTTGDDIRVFTGADESKGRTRELDDLRSASDNDAAASFLLENVRAVAENPDTPLIASIAGGRKTMGALLYACLTLVGRESDRLTHVLVTKPYETLPEFYFPGQGGNSLTDREGNAWDPKDAHLALADVPFVPLRNLFVRELGRKAGSFANLIATCREGVRKRSAQTLHLSLDGSRSQLDVNGIVVKLAPIEHLVIAFLAHRAKDGKPAYGAYKDAINHLEEFRARTVASAPRDTYGDWRQAVSLRTKISDDRTMTKAVADIREKLRKRGGAATVFASCLPERGRCSLDIPGSLIHITD